MKVYTIETGNFKLDGGAMFGVVPKALWQRTNPADDDNMVDVAARSLLVEDGNSLTLIDTGIGDKQDDKFLSYYRLWGDDDLDKSLDNVGFCRDDITDVLMTHLHFDHCGGSVRWSKNHTGYEPAFKNARFWTNEAHWKWATQPNRRERASFLGENIHPLEESGQLNFVPLPSEKNRLVDTGLGFDVLFVDGHTEKQMIPHIRYKGKTIVFVADLVPTVGHLPVPYIAGYDTRPLLSLEEKETFLNNAERQGYYLFFEHDAHNHICTLKKTERGVRYDRIFTFSGIF